jgi:hypothetical protein
LQIRIKEGVPFVHRVPALKSHVSPIDIRVSENGKELSMWVPSLESEETIVSPLAEIDISLFQLKSERFIVVKTDHPILFQEIYGFFVSVIDKIHIEDLDIHSAINETLEAWRELLKARAILSDEVQLGLRGELHVLRALISFIGDEALSAWIGPQNQPHDFRYKDIELEVKATTSAVHSHIINGLAQLEASPGRRLYVFSLRLTPAGAMAGTTLPDDIELTKLALGLTVQGRFEQIIRKHFGYRTEHAALYTRRLQIADKACLISVDDSCPRLSAPLLASVPHRNSISDVRYRVNFEGLGFSEGSNEFHTILSGCRPKLII